VVLQLPLDHRTIVISVFLISQIEFRTDSLHPAPLPRLDSPNPTPLCLATPHLLLPLPAPVLPYLIHTYEKSIHKSELNILMLRIKHRGKVQQSMRRELNWSKRKTYQKGPMATNARRQRAKAEYPTMVVVTILILRGTKEKRQQTLGKQILN